MDHVIKQLSACQSHTFVEEQGRCLGVAIRSGSMQRRTRLVVAGIDLRAWPGNQSGRPFSLQHRRDMHGHWLRGSINTTE
jgi:hypothetical protein